MLFIDCKKSRDSLQSSNQSDKHPNTDSVLSPNQGNIFPDIEQESTLFKFVSPQAKYLCPGGSYLVSAEDEANFSLLANGTILGEYPNTGVFPTHPQDYCVAAQNLFWYCYASSKISTERFREEAYPLLLGMSSVFAFATLFSYHRDDSLGSTMFGKMVMFFLANVAGSYFILSFRDFLLPFPTICIIFGYLSQYSLLSMFFWMNAHALRVFSTFTTFQPVNTSSGKGKKKLVKYCLYAQGCPAIICVITALADQFLANQEFRPNMGEARCFLSCHSGIKCSHTTNRFLMPIFIYYESFKIIINIINFILLAYTGYHITKQLRESAKIQR